jgi:hypothetical protein
MTSVTVCQRDDFAIKVDSLDCMEWLSIVADETQESINADIVGIQQRFMDFLMFGACVIPVTSAQPDTPNARG